MSVLSWFEPKLQILSICKLTSTEEATWISPEPTVILEPVYSDFYLSNRMAWYLSEFTNILFSINHSMATLHSYCNSSIKSHRVVVKNLTLLSSAKLWDDAIKIQKKKPLNNKLNNACPNNDSCYTWHYMFKATCRNIYTNTLLPLLPQDMNKYNVPHFY